MEAAPVLIERTSGRSERGQPLLTLQRERMLASETRCYCHKLGVFFRRWGEAWLSSWERRVGRTPRAACWTDAASGERETETGHSRITRRSPAA